MSAIKTLENAETNQYGQYILSAQEWGGVLEEFEAKDTEIRNLKATAKIAVEAGGVLEKQLNSLREKFEKETPVIIDWWKDYARWLESRFEQQKARYAQDLAELSKRNERLVKAWKILTTPIKGLRPFPQHDLSTLNAEMFYKSQLGLIKEQMEVAQKFLELPKQEETN